MDESSYRRGTLFCYAICKILRSCKYEDDRIVIFPMKTVRRGGRTFGLQVALEVGVHAIPRNSWLFGSRVPGQIQIQGFER